MISTNSSLAPLGPRTRNSLITRLVAAICASPPGRPVGRILTPPDEREAETPPLVMAGAVGTGAVGTAMSPTSGADVDDGADGAGGSGAGLATFSGVRTIVSGATCRAFFRFLVVFLACDLLAGLTALCPARTTPPVATTSSAKIAAQANGR